MAAICGWRSGKCTTASKRPPRSGVFLFIAACTESETLRREDLRVLFIVIRVAPYRRSGRPVPRRGPVAAGGLRADEPDGHGEPAAGELHWHSHLLGVVE